MHAPDEIQVSLEQGIRCRGDAVDGDCCVRARGLPWQASDHDIAKFFVGLNIARSGAATHNDLIHALLAFFVAYVVTVVSYS